MPDSRSQVRLAHEVVEGRATESSMPVSAAREIIRKMHGKKMSSLPEKVSDKQKTLRKMR